MLFGLQEKKRVPNHLPQDPFFRGKLKFNVLKNHFFLYRAIAYCCKTFWCGQTCLKQDKISSHFVETKCRYFHQVRLREVMCMPTSGRHWLVFTTPTCYSNGIVLVPAFRCFTDIGHPPHCVSSHHVVHKINL